MTGAAYSAISAMAAMMAAQHVIGNNLANVDTPGFKQGLPGTSSSTPSW
ncbi:MAG: hypothetical protein FJ029_13235 [Actinobacteria bacterium]|nr:hypothetical protein [Actinomycetota bacterium]